MSGSCKGAYARIQQQYSKANYVHCLSHRLNLFIMVKACGIQEVTNLMGSLEVLNLFFDNSNKRQYLLEKKIQEECLTSTRKRLIAICKTRWVQRIYALEAFFDLLPAVIATLVSVSDIKV